jgi:cysteinyl-tRNA synthetase
LDKLSASTTEIPLSSLPEELQKTVHEREEARKNKDWQKADELRKEIESQGYTLKDTAQGAKILHQ